MILKFYFEFNLYFSFLKTIIFRILHVLYGVFIVFYKTQFIDLELNSLFVFFFREEGYLNLIN
jgi:hypothetical protein